jgi:hypothetical protein
MEQGETLPFTEKGKVLNSIATQFNVESDGSVSPNQCSGFHLDVQKVHELFDGLVKIGRKERDREREYVRMKRNE